MSAEDTAPALCPDVENTIRGMASSAPWVEQPYKCAKRENPTLSKGSFVGVPGIVMLSHIMRTVPTETLLLVTWVYQESIRVRVRIIPKTVMF